jgi:hypothetical protein
MPLQPEISRRRAGTHPRKLTPKISSAAGRSGKQTESGHQKRQLQGFNWRLKNSTIEVLQNPHNKFDEVQQNT